MWLMRKLTLGLLHACSGLRSAAQQKGVSGKHGSTRRTFGLPYCSSEGFIRRLVCQNLKPRYVAIGVDTLPAPAMSRAGSKWLSDHHTT